MIERRKKRAEMEYWDIISKYNDMAFAVIAAAFVWTAHTFDWKRLFNIDPSHAFDPARPIATGVPLVLPLFGCVLLAGAIFVNHVHKDHKSQDVYYKPPTDPNSLEGEAEDKEPWLTNIMVVNTILAVTGGLACVLIPFWIIPDWPTRHIVALAVLLVLVASKMMYVGWIYDLLLHKEKEAKATKRAAKRATRRNSRNAERLQAKNNRKNKGGGQQRGQQQGQQPRPEQWAHPPQHPGGSTAFDPRAAHGNPAPGFDRAQPRQGGPGNQQPGGRPPSMGH